MLTAIDLSAHLGITQKAGALVMASTKNYRIIDLETGQLDRYIFADPDVYQEELEKIFGRAWLMIGHESLIPEPNDFFHTYMGEDPVILVHNSQGSGARVSQHVPASRQPHCAGRHRQCRDALCAPITPGPTPTTATSPTCPASRRRTTAS